MKKEPHKQIPFDVHDYLRPLYRRRWLAGTAFSVTVVIALVYAFTATPVYRATARLLIEPRDPNVVTFQQVIEERAQFGVSVQTTQRDMLRSRTLARMTIERLDLWDHPEFGGSEDGTAWFNLRALNPVVWARRGLSWLRSKIFPSPSSPEGVADAESRVESSAISSLLSRLEVVAGRNSRIVTLRFSSFEPQLAATVINTLMQLHVERDMEFRFTSSRKAASWLQERIAEQRLNLEASEWLLQSYRERHGAAAIEDRQTMIVRDLENLHSAATSATMARLGSEARHRDLQAAQGDVNALGHFPDILRNDVIQEEKLTLASLRRQRAQLTEELCPRHPDMINIESSIRDAENRLRDEILAVVDSLRIEFQVASSRERQLLAELDRRTQEALALDRTGIEYGMMRREAESARELYEALLLRAAETGVTGELETSNIRILDEAETPIRPARPQRQLIVLMGLLGGGLLGVGLVFAVDQVDDAITTPDEMKTHLDAPYLGLVPYTRAQADDAGGRKKSRARSSKRDERELLLHAGVPATFAEAIRSVRTSLIFSSADEGARSVLVTSTAPGEGKSCISANLAISLAQLGRRTLLVDADLRRPQQHSLFGVDLEPGLSNLLATGAAESAVVRETSVPGLSLVPAGKTPPNPTDLVGSARFAQFVDSCRARFDWIVFDTTPVLPVADALVAAKVVGKVLFVVATGTTSRRAAADALGKLDEAGAGVLGAVLNKAALERHPYYYSRYYRREYSRYYSRQPAP